ncbi:hypothetical protein [Methylobacterium oxalidis]|nr:hypothetical protein [Methylobacterium oxalidis]GJE34139.1 hypothetical protein LDDCCGHA_4345 [Methylobacterium oxalidis]
MTDAFPSAALAGRPRYTPLIDVAEIRAVPAMPLGRKLAVATAPLLRPGPRLEACFARAFDRIEAGLSQRAVRVEFAERIFADDLRILADPARLSHQLLDVVSGVAERTRLSHWFLDRGDWSRALMPLSASEVTAEIEALFSAPGRIEESAAFAALLARAESGAPAVRNGVSLADGATIAAYFAHYDALRRSIEQEGFRPRTEVDRQTARAFFGSRVRSRKAERLERDIGVAVDADGTLLRLCGGHHRTAIAQRLGLPRVPVQVRLVHAEWLRGWIGRTGLPPARAIAQGLRHLSACLGAVLAPLVPVLAAVPLP